MEIGFIYKFRPTDNDNDIQWIVITDLRNNAITGALQAIGFNLSDATDIRRINQEFWPWWEKQ